MNSEIKETKGIRAMMILEIIGKPAEHLVETLEKIIKQIDEEDGVEVIEKKMNEPVLVKDKKTGEITGQGMYLFLQAQHQHGAMQSKDIITVMTGRCFQCSKMQVILYIRIKVF